MAVKYEEILSPAATTSEIGPEGRQLEKDFGVIRQRRVIRISLTDSDLCYLCFLDMVDHLALHLLGRLLSRFYETRCLEVYTLASTLGVTSIMRTGTAIEVP